MLRGYRELDAAAREGDRVRITGTVRAVDELLIAPLSGHRCVAYRARARVHGQASRDLRAPARFARGSEESVQLRPFVVARVADAIVVIGEHARFGGRPVDGPFDGDRRVSFLARHGNPGVGVRYSELIVEPGMRVTVAGTLVLVPPEAPPPGERGFREPPPLEPRLVGSRDAPLVIIAD